VSAGCPSPPDQARLTIAPLSGRSPIRAAAAAACALALAVVGCGGTGREDQGTIHGRRLTIYASTPLDGTDAASARDVVRGERLALAEAHDRVGRYDVRLVSLDAATPQAAGWDPSQISQNARRAAADPRAIAYLGELDDSSSAVSIPLLNEAGILEVSPGDTALALTAPTSAVAASPERYYPKLKLLGRTFARLVPDDRVQGRALVRYMGREDVKRLALLTDEDTTALALTEVVQAAAPERGIAVVANQTIDERAQDFRAVVAQVIAQRPDAILYSGGIRDRGMRRGPEELWRELAAADPALKLFAPAAVADGAFVARIGARAGALTYVTRPVLALAAYPWPARRVTRAFAARYGAQPAPEALYGYEAMRMVLAAIRRAVGAAGDGAVTRAEVVRAFFATRRRASALGPYAIDAQGDTSLTTFGAYRVAGGRLSYAGRLDG